VDRNGLARRYVASLSGRVRPHVVYPRAAIIAGIEGTVTIGLLVDAQGNILRRRVTRSSGHPSLDTAALDAAERVASVAAPPAELLASWAGGAQEIQLPLRMTLTR
jgi:protein TonB